MLQGKTLIVMINLLCISDIKSFLSNKRMWKKINAAVVVNTAAVDDDGGTFER